MKEKEPNELTNQSNSSNLEREGEVFMAEPGAGETQLAPAKETKKPEIKTPEVTTRDSLEKRQEAARAHFERENSGKKLSVDELRTQQMLIERGVMPIAGGAEDNGGEKPPPPAEPTPEEPRGEGKKRAIGPDDAQRILESLRREAESVVSGLSLEEAHDLETFRSIAGAQGIDRDIIDTQIANAIIKMRGRKTPESQAGQEGYRLPESLEDLAQLIMDSESDEWKPKGKKELIRDGKVVKEHFLAWIRKRAVEIDVFNPTSNINLFSDIHVKFGYSQIALFDMVLTGSYFLKRERQEDGTYKTSKDSDYEKLKQEIIKEAFLYNNDKNKWVTYKGKMHSEAEMPELLIGLYYADPNFREDYLEQEITLASTNEAKIKKIRDEAGEAFAGHEAEKVLEGNLDLGEGIRRAFLTYYHLADFEMLSKIHGEDSFLFSEEYMEIGENGDIVMENGKPKMKKGVANERLKKGRIEYKKGRLVNNDDNRSRFIRYMNIFNNANKPTIMVAEVRERIRQDLMRDLGLDYEEASFAERWAFNKTLPAGVGGRNDTDASAFDAISRGINTLPYRLKQYMKKRKGQVGNPFDFGLIKRTALTPLEEITDVNGRTVIEAIQGGQGSEYDEHNPFDKKREDYRSMTFGQDEGQRWSSMAFLNGDTVRKLIMEGKGFDIDNLLSYDTYGRPIIDQQKADEFLDKVQKAMRYKWCTWAGTDYSKTTRVMEWKRVEEHDASGRPKIDRNGEHAFHYEPVWRDIPILSAYFGPEIVGLIKSDIERVKKRTRKKGDDLREGRESIVWHMEGIGGDEKIDISEAQNSDIRDYLWKHVEKAFVAKTLEAHRNVFSELQRYGYSMVEKFYDFFRAKDIWDEEDEKEVRKLSKTTEGRLLAEEIPLSILLGMLDGAWKEIRKEAPKVFAS